MLLTGKGSSPLGSRDRNYFSKPRVQARGFFFYVTIFSRQPPFQPLRLC